MHFRSNLHTFGRFWKYITDIQFARVQKVSPRPEDWAVNRPASFVWLLHEEIHPTCVSAGVRMVASRSDQHESGVAAIGEVAPLPLTADDPGAPHLWIHTINTNRSTALIPRPSSGIVRRPAPCDRRVRSGGP
jgi:hypothetical protein